MSRARALFQFAKIVVTEVSAAAMAAKVLGDIVFPVSVQSSFISSIGYDPESQLMTVNFTNGESAEYPGTDPDEVLNFIQAGSKGRHYWSRFRVARGRKG